MRLMNREQLYRKLDECVSEGRTPVVFIKRPLVVSGSFNGIRLAELAIDQGAATKVVKGPKLPEKRIVIFATIRRYKRRGYKVRYYTGYGRR